MWFFVIIIKPFYHHRVTGLSVKIPYIFIFHHQEGRGGKHHKYSDIQQNTRVSSSSFVSLSMVGYGRHKR